MRPDPGRPAARGVRLHAIALAALPALVLPVAVQECGGTDPGTGPSASELLALTETCAPLPGVSAFATDSGGASTIRMCELNGAIWFKADMDIDCDGGSGFECKSDPYYQSETSYSDSNGDPLDASTLPFIVLPIDSNGFYISDYGIAGGTVAAVIYGDQVEYGVLGDRGPKGVVGEASYAMADLFGIDPDPISGGVSSGVTYIVFTDRAIVDPIESHSAAVELGIEEANQLLADN